MLQKIMFSFHLIYLSSKWMVAQESLIIECFDSEPL